LLVISVNGGVAGFLLLLLLLLVLVLTALT
jgi:hypothetical protein